jgi:hypothetical protein
MRFDGFPEGGPAVLTLMSGSAALPSLLPTYPPFERRRPDVAQANSCRDSKGEQELEKKAVIIVSLEVA